MMRGPGVCGLDHRINCPPAPLQGLSHLQEIQACWSGPHRSEFYLKAALAS